MRATSPYQVVIINSTSPVDSATADFDLQRFAYRVAGPRDFVINLLINGTIAWFVFGGAVETSLAGADSIFKMLLPMSAIESTLTTFFGVLNGTVELRKRRTDTAEPDRVRWLMAAIGFSLFQGTLGFVTMLICRYVLGALLPTTNVPFLLVVAIVGLTSGTLAFVLHSRAVLFSRRVA